MRKNRKTIQNANQHHQPTNLKEKEREKNHEKCANSRTPLLLPKSSLLLRVQPTLLNSQLHPPNILLHILPIQLRRLRIRRTIRVRIVQQTLYARQDRSNVIRRRPPILQNIQTQLPIRIHVGVEHPREELDSGRFVRVRFIECEHQLEGAVFEWGVACCRGVE